RLRGDDRRHGERLLPARAPPLAARRCPGPPLDASRCAARPRPAAGAGGVVMPVEALLRSLTEPLQYDFIRNALLEVVLLGIAAGTVGAFVYLRGLAFFAHALSHTVFPGLVIGVMAGFNPLVGGAAAALVTALAVGGLARRRHVAPDSAIAI